MRKQMIRGARGRGGGFLLSGEPGTGRSRMLDLFVLEAKMLGMLGNVDLPIVGAVLLYTVQEIVWVQAPHAHLIAFGVFLILVARFMPRGIVGFFIDRGWAKKGMVH